MDRKSYLGTFYYLTSVQNRHFDLLISCTQKHKQENAYQVFGTVAGEFLFIRSVYANIDTEYFCGTSNIFFA